MNAFKTFVVIWTLSVLPPILLPPRNMQIYMNRTKSYVDPDTPPRSIGKSQKNADIRHRVGHLLSLNATTLLQTPPLLGTQKKHLSEILVWGNSSKTRFYEFPFVTEGNNDDNATITLFTQASVNKLPRVVSILQRWKAPISCAVYIAKDQDLDAFLSFLEEEADGDNDQNGGDRLVSRHVAFHLMVEPIALNNGKHRDLPLNQLRKMAMQHARTDYVFLLDVDFVPSEGAYESIAKTMRLLQQDEQNANGNINQHEKTMYILPAFEQFPEEGKEQVTDVDAIPKNKRELLQALAKKRVDPFHYNYFKPGHGATNYSKWFALPPTKEADEQHLRLYAITYSCRYFEPYVVARKEQLPTFYADFRGYGYNKASWFAESALKGFKFEVLPDDFVVHMNHPGRQGRKHSAATNEVQEQFLSYLRSKYGRSKLESQAPPCTRAHGYG